MKCSWPAEWSERERLIADTFVEVFGNQPTPEPSVAADAVNLHDGELDGLLGHHWLTIFSERDTRLHWIDWILLTDEGNRHYLPAFMLATFGPESIGDVDFLTDFLLSDGERIWSTAPAAQRKAVCLYLRHREQISHIAAEELDEEDLVHGEPPPGWHDLERQRHALEELIQRLGGEN